MLVIWKKCYVNLTLFKTWAVTKFDIKSWVTFFKLMREIIEARKGELNTVISVPYFNTRRLHWYWKWSLVINNLLYTHSWTTHGNRHGQNLKVLCFVNFTWMLSVYVSDGLSENSDLILSRFVLSWPQLHYERKQMCLILPQCSQHGKCEKKNANEFCRNSAIVPAVCNVVLTLCSAIEN